MLSSNELSNLQNLISDETITFKELIDKFTSSFDKLVYFKICLTLDILIKDQQLNLFQEISAFYILYYLNRLEIGCSAFSSLALKILNETKSKTKIIILINLLKNNSINVHQKIVEHIKIIENSQIKINIDKEIKNIQEIVNKGKNDKKISVLNSIITSKEISDNKVIKQKTSNKKNLDKNLFKFLESPYMSFYPLKSEEIFKNEIKWILPSIKHNFIWENNCNDKIKYLLNQILEDGAVTSEEINYIISTIKKKPNTIKNINFTPKLMMELIEKDESLSFEILSVVCKMYLNE
jgi:hypothetical protein